MSNILQWLYHFISYQKCVRIQKLYILASFGILFSLMLPFVFTLVHECWYLIVVLIFISLTTNHRFSVSNVLLIFSPFLKIRTFPYYCIVKKVLNIYIYVFWKSPVLDLYLASIFYFSSIYIFIYCWILFDDVLIRAFASMFMRHILFCAFLLKSLPVFSIMIMLVL